MTKKQRQEVYEKYGGRCAYCGCELKKGWHVDHLDPIKRYLKGSGCEYPDRDCIENMMPSCPACNIQKHSMPIESFRLTVTQFISSLNKYNSIYRFAKRYRLIEETGKPVVFYFESLHNKQ